jgi:RNA polymerase sigma-70 factor (ECF subfamily)
MLTSEQESIFKGWIDEHQGLMFKIIRAYTDKPQDADDLFQDILTQLWISIPRFKGRSKASTWIYKVSLNMALTWKRGQKKKQKIIIEHHQPEAADLQTNETSDNEIIDQLYDSIRQLPKIETSLILMHLDGLSYNEISDVLGISESNVGVKLNRARKKLAHMLKDLENDI